MNKIFTVSIRNVFWCNADALSELGLADCQWLSMCNLIWWRFLHFLACGHIIWKIIKCYWTWELQYQTHDACKWPQLFPLVNFLKGLQGLWWNVLSDWLQTDLSVAYLKTFPQEENQKKCQQSFDNSLKASHKLTCLLQL